AANRWRYQPSATVHLPGGPFGASRVAGLICDRSMDFERALLGDRPARDAQRQKGPPLAAAAPSRECRLLALSWLRQRVGADVRACRGEGGEGDDVLLPV